MASNQQKVYIVRELNKILIPGNSAINLSVNRGQPNAKSIQFTDALPLEKSTLGAVQPDTFDVANNLADAVASGVQVVSQRRTSYETTIIKMPKAIVQETLQEAVADRDRANDLIQSIKDRMSLDIFDYVFWNWLPTLPAQMLATTGLDSAGSVTKRNNEIIGGYSGLVNAFAYQDLVALGSLVARQNINGGAWYALPSVKQWEELKAIKEVTSYNETGVVDKFGRMMVGKFRNINFLDPRHNEELGVNCAYDVTIPANPVPYLYEGLLNANTVDSMLVWNDQCVERNQGKLTLFTDMDNPVYMGDVRRAGYRIGSSMNRITDQRGVIAVTFTPTV